MKASNGYISFSLGAAFAMFFGAIADFQSRVVAVNAALAIIFAILSVTHAIRERARGGE